jgi:hypothetical protein
VVVHQSYVENGFRYEGDQPLPVKLHNLTEALIVDGTIVILLSQAGGPGEILKGIHPGASQEFVVQDTGMRQRLTKKSITREWTRKGSVWHWKDYTDYGTDMKAIVAESNSGISDQLFIVYENGPGLFYKPQFLFRRLEEIEEDTRAITRKLKIMIVAGYTGQDLNKTTNTLGDERNKILQFPQKVDVYYPTSTAAVDQLQTNHERLIALFWKNVHMVELDDSSQASGVARRLVMKPMLNYVTQIRDSVTEIFEMFGVKEYSFDRIVTSTVQERRDELALLMELRNANVIDQPTFELKASQLV